MSGRLVCVSNRTGTTKAPSGGLAVALSAALRQRGGIWFGWNGQIAEEGASAGEPDITHEENVEIVAGAMTRQEYENYYLGFSNSVLWPVCHHRLDHVSFRREYVDEYRRVNRRFAHQLAPRLQEGDLVWVHDYHLMPLGAELRAQQLGLRMGFFLHVPFPPPDTLMVVPDHEWLVRSLFSYDLVGFQTQGDCMNFLHYVLEQAGGEMVGESRVKAFGRALEVRAFPIGIDVEAFREMARTAEARRTIRRMRQRNLGRAQIIGVDRLDYSKGLPERYRAFQKLLEHYPETRGRVVLMQIAQPTREAVDAYSDLRQELEWLSGAINGSFGDFEWTPIRSIHRSVPRSTLAALFVASRVGLVTPLRDGMNLVAKEYVAAQDPEDPGVLVLSRFAGAAEMMTSALLVNPYNAEEMATALQTALQMPLEERVERHRDLMRVNVETDVAKWRSSFLSVLEAVSQS
jgi:trehalose 6-phosphate synthase